MLTRMVDGKRETLSAQEEAETRAEWAANDALQLTHQRDKLKEEARKTALYLLVEAKIAPTVLKIDTMNKIALDTFDVVADVKNNA